MPDWRGANGEDPLDGAQFHPDIPYLSLAWEKTLTGTAISLGSFYRTPHGIPYVHTTMDGVSCTLTVLRGLLTSGLFTSKALH